MCVCTHMDYGTVLINGIYMFKMPKFVGMLIKTALITYKYALSIEKCEMFLRKSFTFCEH